MRVYIAGPIAGYPDGNRGAFRERAQKLREDGHVPVNPWDIGPDHDGPCAGGGPVDHEDTGHQYGCYLRADIEVLLYCEGISLLPGWEQSRGASTEEHIARSIGLEVVEP